MRYYFDAVHRPLSVTLMAGQDSDILGMVQDRGMAAEIIKLLGDELRRVQCEITEMQSGKEVYTTCGPCSEAQG